MAWPDTLFALIKQVAIGGSPLTQRSTLNFVSGATAVDNPTLGTTDVSITPGGQSAGQLYFSPVDIATGAGLTGIVSNSGARSFGVCFGASQAGHSCTGVRFYWAGGSTTIKCSLWDGGTATRVENVSVAVTGAGIYTATFASSYALTAGAPMAVTVWDTAGSPHFTSYNGTTTGTAPMQNFIPASGTSVIGGPFMVFTSSADFHGPSVQADTWAIYATTDAIPNSSDSSLYAPVEPILI